MNIFLCDDQTSAVNCTNQGGVGGATGRYGIIDWPDAAFVMNFQGQVPEPGTLLLLGAGLVSTAFVARRGRRR